MNSVKKVIVVDSDSHPYASEWTPKKMSNSNKGVRSSSNRASRQILGSRLTSERQRDFEKDEELYNCLQSAINLAAQESSLKEEPSSDKKED